MTLNKSIVKQNISLLSINTDKFKTEAITFSLSLPLSPRAYLLSLVLCGVMRRGSQKFSTMASIYKKFDDLYAASFDIHASIQTNAIIFSAYSDFLGNRYSIDGTDISDGVIEVIADMLLHPLMKDGTFNEKTVNDEVALVRDYIDAEINNTRAYAAGRCRELLRRSDQSFPTFDYMRDSIDSVTAEELSDFYRELIGGSALDVLYVGSEDAKVIASKISSRFDGFGGSSDFKPAATNACPAREFVSKTKDMPVNQGKLVMGFLGTQTAADNDYHCAILFNEILGGSPASKLFMNVREKMGLCYYCSSSFEMDSGSIIISCGIDSSNKNVAHKAILDQIESIKHGQITDKELTAAKRSIEFAYELIYDSPTALQGFYKTRDMMGIDENIEQFKEKIYAVNAEQIQDVAKRLRYDCFFFVRGT